MMNIGDGPMAFLTLGNVKNSAVRVGETIGPFKLLEVTGDDVVFEWDGKPVHQQLSKPGLEVSGGGEQAARGETPRPQAAAPPPAVLKGPGELLYDGRRTCYMNDGNPPGAVVDGMRKVVYTTPTGQSCGWEKQ